MTQQMIVAPEQQQAASAWVYLMQPAMELARVIKNTDFVPKGLRGNEAAITAALLTANELGVGGMTGLANIAIVEGKPALSATLMRALVLSRGHEIWFEDLKTTSVTACGRRRGPDAPITRVSWTMEMARTALLINKDNWKKYPRAMLEARSSSELCRLVFADCLAGLMHSVEELEDGIVTVDAGGDTRPPETGNTRRRRLAAPSVASVDETPPGQRPALPTDAPAPPPSEPAAVPEGQTPQLKKLHAAFGKIDVKDREDRLAITALILEREVASSKDLNTEEVDKVVATLDDHLNGAVRVVKADGRWQLWDAAE
jgi:hypothetical protein